MNRLRGSANLGNTCFLNSAVQLLCRAHIVSDAALKHFGELDHPVVNVLRQFRDAPAGQIVNLSGLQQTLVRAGLIAAGRQEDAHEVLTWLLDTLPRPLHVLYDVGITSSVTCGRCGGVSSHVVQEKSVPLPIHGPSFDTAYSAFTGQEKLEGDNAYQCDGCKAKTEAVRASSLTQLSRYLFVCLKRYTAAGKIVDEVAMPVTINTSINNYVLAGFIVHYGSSYGGHYVTYVRDPANNAWFVADDSNIRQESAIPLHHGYVYLYEAV